VATVYKRFPDGHVRPIRTARTTPRKGPILVSALFSAFVSVLVRSGLGFIVLLQSSCLQRFMLGQSCAPVLSFRSALLLSVFYNGKSAAADSDFVFYFSNLSWNTNDETLSAVRLIFFWLCLRYLFLIPSSPRFFSCDVMAYCQ
jgi:hypothetical protein